MTLLEDVCLQSEGRERRFLRRWSLRARFTVFFWNDPSLFSEHGVSSLSLLDYSMIIRLVFRASTLSPLSTSTTGAGIEQRKRPERRREALPERERKGSRCQGSPVGRLESVREASSDSDADFSPKLLQTGLPGLSVFVLEVVKGPHSRGDRFLDGFHLFGARNGVCSFKHIAESASRDCGGPFYSPEESKDRVERLGAIAVKVPQLFKDRECAESKETGAKLFAEKDPVQRGGCEVY